MEFEVVCVDHGIFPQHGSRIIRFGVRDGDGVVVLKKSDVLYRMSRGDRFFVNKVGKKAYLIKGVSSQGNTFLQTEGDATVLNNLSSLPSCTHDDPITYGTGASDPNDVDAGSDGGGDAPGGHDDVDVGGGDE